MKLVDTEIPEVKVVELQAYEDERGFFMEVWHAEKFAGLGLDLDFVQDNHSRSARGTLRGLHYQLPRPQGKLVRCVRGEVFDVAVDIRRDSPTFARTVALRLSEADRRQLWIPPGFAHGFLALTDGAEVLYKCTEKYYREHDRVVAWDDPRIGIDWPLDEVEEVLVSDKDRAAPRLDDLPPEHIPPRRSHP